MRVAKSLGRLFVKVSASQEVASPPIQVRCITHTIPPTRQVVPLVGVQRWLWQVSAIWQSEAIRAAQLAFQVPGAAHMVSNPPMASYLIQGYSLSNRRWTIRVPLLQRR